MRRNILFSVLVSLLSVTSTFAGYVDNDNGTVSDTNTNLVWQKHDDDQLRNWENAISYCEGLIVGGFTDWRLPNIKELSSLVDDSRYNPSIDPLFASTETWGYWSSTAFSTADAWYVSFDNGYTLYSNKASETTVRCVRGQ